MRLVTWNTRGINKLHKQREFKNVGIIAVLEHKIKEHLAKKVTQKLAQGWKWEANY